MPTDPLTWWLLRCDAGNIPSDQMCATEQAAWDVLRLHRLACPGGHEVDPVRPAGPDADETERICASLEELLGGSSYIARIARAAAARQHGEDPR